MAITRIQNNQITDATIVAYAKVAAGSLTGNLFAPTVTLNSNVTINGNLFLSNTGNVTTINATNTYINDPLVMFNNGYTGSLTGYDIGILVNRNLASLASYGSVNTFLGWVEADSAFETLATTDTGTGITSINNAGWANFKTGNLTALTTSTGGLQAVAIGNVTPGSGAFTTGTFSSTLGVTGATTMTTATTGGLQAVAIGNATPGSGAFTSLTSSTTYTLNTGTAASLQATAIGNATPGSGAFTTLTASGITQITNSTASSATTNGALVVTGGVGIGGDMYVGGNITALNIYGATQNTVTIQDPLVYLQALGNLGTYNYDIGFYSDYTASAYRHTGLARSFASNTWNFFSNVLSEPGAGGINWSDIGLAYDSVKMGQLTIANSTVSSSTASGALQVSGGAGIVGSAYIGGGVQNTPIGNAAASTAFFTTANATNVYAATIGNAGATLTGATVTTSGVATFNGNVTHAGATFMNSSQTAGYDTIIRGKNDATLIWARPNATYDTVIIGNSATASTVVNGAKLIINTNDSILLPVGTNAQRPTASGLGTDTTGMFRYSTTAGAIEWYTGSAWTAATTSFTVIADQQFNGTGSQTIFTLSEAQTTNSCIVSINGVIQIPTLAYAVTSGTTLTFTEAPASGDVIDVRKLTTTNTVTGIASTNGYMQVQIDNNGVYVYTGTASTAVTTFWSNTGARINAVANVTTSTVGDATLDSFYANTYSSAEYTITATLSGTSIREIAKVLVVHNGSTTSRVVYGVVNTAGNSLVTYSANIVNGSSTLYGTPTNANTVFRIQKNYQAI